MYQYVLSTYRYIPFDDLKYVPGTYFFYRLCTRKPTFFIGLNLVHTSTYSRKKVYTEYILREKKYVPASQAQSDSENAPEGTSNHCMIAKA